MCTAEVPSQESVGCGCPCWCCSAKPTPDLHPLRDTLTSLGYQGRHRPPRHRQPTQAPPAPALGRSRLKTKPETEKRRLVLLPAPAAACGTQLPACHLPCMTSSREKTQTDTMSCLPRVFRNQQCRGEMPRHCRKSLVRPQVSICTEPAQGGRGQRAQAGPGMPCGTPTVTSHVPASPLGAAAGIWEPPSPALGLTCSCSLVPPAPAPVQPVGPGRRVSAPGLGSVLPRETTDSPGRAPALGPLCHVHPACRALMQPELTRPRSCQCRGRQQPLAAAACPLQLHPNPELTPGHPTPGCTPAKATREILKWRAPGRADS